MFLFIFLSLLEQAAGSSFAIQLSGFPEPLEGHSGHYVLAQKVPFSPILTPHELDPLSWAHGRW